MFSIRAANQLFLIKKHHMVTKSTAPITAKRLSISEAILEKVLGGPIYFLQQMAEDYMLEEIRKRSVKSTDCAAVVELDSKPVPKLAFQDQAPPLKSTKTSNVVKSQSTIRKIAVNTAQYLGRQFSFIADISGLTQLSDKFTHAVAYLKTSQYDQVLQERLLEKMIYVCLLDTPWGSQPLNVVSQRAQDVDLLKSTCILDPYGKAVMSGPLSFGFSGSSWLLSYELGAASAIQHEFRPEVMEQCTFLGSQTGCIPAVALAFGLDAEAIQEEFTFLAQRNSRYFLGGKLNQIASLIKPLLEKWIPQDISCLGNRLVISLTEYPSGKERKVSLFKNKQDLIDHILASCSLPLIGKYHVKSRDDGMLLVGNSYSKTRKLAPTKDSITITIQPFYGSANICPNFDNYEVAQEWWSTSDSSFYETIFDDGYLDTTEFIMKKTNSGYLSTNLFPPVEYKVASPPASDFAPKVVPKKSIAQKAYNLLKNINPFTA